MQHRAGAGGRSGERDPRCPLLTGETPHTAAGQGAVMNPLKALGEQGQSVWLDYMRRNLVTSGELKRLIENDGVKGLTSNPTIFQEGAPRGASAGDVFEALAIRDIGDAARTFRPVWEQTKHRDGYCSIEVTPTLAHDAKGTVVEARRLWQKLGVQNVMVKIPGTVEGTPAIEQCVAEGININVTLLFSQDAYVAVAEAYIRGLEQRAARGEDVSKSASVASFF